LLSFFLLFFVAAWNRPGSLSHETGLLSPGPLLSFVLIQKKVTKEKIKKMSLASNSSF